jgi:hypothetical protein
MELTKKMEESTIIELIIAISGLIVSFGGVVAIVVSYFKSKLDLNRVKEHLTEEIKATKLTALRVEAWQAMNDNSAPETVSLIYDKYVKLGGNSYMTKKVSDYIERYENQ